RRPAHKRWNSPRVLPAAAFFVRSLVGAQALVMHVPKPVSPAASGRLARKSSRKEAEPCQPPAGPSECGNGPLLASAKNAQQPPDPRPVSVLAGLVLPAQAVGNSGPCLADAHLIPLCGSQWALELSRRQGARPWA